MPRMEQTWFCNICNTPYDSEELAKKCEDECGAFELVRVVMGADGAPVSVILRRKESKEEFEYMLIEGTMQ